MRHPFNILLTAAATLSWSLIAYIGLHSIGHATVDQVASSEPVTVPRDLEVEGGQNHSFGSYTISHRDLGSILAAARFKGVPGDIALAASEILSGLSSANRGAAEGTSQGWFMFSETAWMRIIDTHGQDWGVTTETYSPAQILELRHDPFISSVMALSMWAENREELEGVVTGNDEFLIPHLLGIQNTRRLGAAIRDNPNTPVNEVLGDTVTANRFIFHSGDDIRSAADTWNNLAANMRTARNRYSNAEHTFIEAETDIQDAARGF